MGMSSIGFITLDKVVSLFIDLNFGLLPYFPILLILGIVSFGIGLYKKEVLILGLWCVLILMAVICSTESNWNCGMMYIHRYLIYFIPILLGIILFSYDHYPKKAMTLLLVASILVTATVTLLLFINYDTGNYVKFNILSRQILIHAPYMYNPPYEVFAERTVGYEIDYSKSLPVIFSDNGHSFKILTDANHIPDVEKSLNITIPTHTINIIKANSMGYINN
jgi:hypothetical protein